MLVIPQTYFLLWNPVLPSCDIFLHELHWSLGLLFRNKGADPSAVTYLLRSLEVSDVGFMGCFYLEYGQTGVLEFL